MRWPFYLCLLSACGGEAPAALPAVAADPQLEFLELISTEWELPPGTEQYLCVRKTMTETMYLGGSRSESPAGTHHVVLTVFDQPDGEPDGVTPCDVATVGTRNVFGAGVGGMPRLLPPGIAMKLERGSQLLLNLHLFNVGEEPLRGRSGMAVLPIDEADVKILADGVFAGTMQLNIPPGRSSSQGRCTFDRDATIFGVLPHMHQTGVAMKVVAHTAQHGDVVFFDGPYDFDRQLVHPVDMVTVQKGDVIDVSCTFENPTASTLRWGESTNDEMCNAGLARFPAGGPSVCNR